jgi:hypothetical protein
MNSRLATPEQMAWAILDNIFDNRTPDADERIREQLAGLRAFVESYVSDDDDTAAVDAANKAA